MTREHKLALIFGFALVLIVGLLISDNFSASHKATPGGPSLTESQPLPIFKEEVAIRGAETAQPVVSDPAVGPAPGSLAMGTPEPDRTLGDRLSESTSAVGTAFKEALVDLGNGRLPPKAAVTETLPQTPVTNPSGDALPVADNGLNGSGADTTVLTGPQRKLPLTPHEPPAAASKDKRYQVAEGDTFWKIARSQYADPSLAEALKSYNKDRIGKAGQLRAGASILVPDKSVLTGNRPAGAGEAKPADEAKNPPKTGVARKTSTYVVKKGDTLARIAARTLGSASKVDVLLKANKGVIDSADEIREGDTLTIPAD